MPLDRWWRPKPQLTGRELADEVGRRRLARGITAPNPIKAEPEGCEEGCAPESLFRVVLGPTLVGSLICRECGTVYRRDTPSGEML